MKMQMIMEHWVNAWTTAPVPIRLLPEDKIVGVVETTGRGVSLLVQTVMDQGASTAVAEERRLHFPQTGMIWPTPEDGTHWEYRCSLHPRSTPGEVSMASFHVIEQVADRSPRSAPLGGRIFTTAPDGSLVEVDRVLPLSTLERLVDQPDA